MSNSYESDKVYAKLYSEKPKGWNTIQHCSNACMCHHKLSNIKN